MRMYDIPDELRRLHDEAVDPETGEIAEDYESRIEELEAELERKIEWLGLLATEKAAAAVPYRDQAIRLNARAHTLENEARRIKDYLRAILTAAGHRKVVGDLCTVALQRNSRPSIEWVADLACLPDRFARVIPEQRHLDSAAALAAWKESAEKPENRTLIDGFRVELGEHVRIR